jgi:putative hydrolase of the HAD superfamily
MVIVFDLDDTLYDEIEFVKSGFREVSNYLGDKKYFEFMQNEFLENGSGKIFNKLIENFNLNIPLQKLIEIYRFHKPKIILPGDSIELLEFSKKYNSALISDGHYITQQNKFLSLNLEKYIEYPIFTDFYHTKKPELKPFKMVMQKFPNKKYIYISDNPKKDFIAPKKLGWKTIRFKNKNGIYKDIENNADYEVYSRKEILAKLKEILWFTYHPHI